MPDWSSAVDLKFLLLNYKGFYYLISIPTLYLDAMYFNAHTFAFEEAIFTFCCVCTIFVRFNASCNQYFNEFDLVPIIV